MSRVCNRKPIRRPRILPFAGVLLLAIFVCPPACFGEDVELSYSTELDWARGTFDLEIRDSSPSSGLILRTAADQRIASRLPALLRAALSPIRVDSKDTIESLILRRPELVDRIAELADRSRRNSSVISGDLSSYIVTYRYSIPGEILPLIGMHQSAYKPYRLLEFIPSGDFTGIVVYAQGVYPVRGEPNRTSIIHPSIFPSIYDAEMNLIIEREMVEPNVLTTSGMVGYSDSTDLADYRERTGPSPLTTMALEVFGKNRTDIIIPVAAGNRIRSRDHTLDLISKGRIVIIYDSDLIIGEYE